MENLITFRSSKGITVQIASAATTTTTTVTVHGIARFQRGGAVMEGETPTCTSLSVARFNPAIKSLADCHRSSGSVDKHLYTTQTSNSGVIG